MHSLRSIPCGKKPLRFTRIAAAAFLLFLFSRALCAQESGAVLMDLNLGDSSVSFQASGSWAGSLNAGFGFALTPFGNSALAGDTPFFKQEVDLTLSLWMLDRWFVEGTFLDDYSLNTYRAGYRGLAGEIVQYAGVGNTGLDFPAFPYLDLGGASPSSFGFYGRFGGEDFAVHSLVRYDFAAREEKVFSGGRERTYSYTDPANFLRGVSFILPDADLSGVPLIYIEDKNGTLTDSQGRRWRLLESSEYAASAVNGIVELNLGAYTGGSVEPEGMIAVSYSKNGSQNPWAASLGNYGASGTAGTGFLGAAQAYFDSSGRNFNLADYPQSGGAFAPSLDRPGATTINSTPALIIYERGTFSPFERQSLYRAPATGTASLIRLSTGTVVQGYELLPDANDAQGISRLVRGGVSPEGRAEKDRWPLAAADSPEVEPWPELYVPGAQIFTADLGIRTTSYGAVDSFDIGTDIVPDSIQVFRDGLLDPDFTYNQASGTVSLGTASFFNELIRISYLKRSEELKAGNIAAGVGATWKQGEHFSSGIGLGLRWNLSGSDFSEQAASSPGTAGLGAEARWNYDTVKAGLTLGLGLEQPDTSGLYRAAGMEGNEFVIGLPAADSFLSTPASSAPVNNFSLETRAPLVYRNYRELDLLAGSSLGSITSSAEIVSGQSGPYPAMDSAFTPGGSVQILAAEFELGSERNWTGFEIPLNENGSVLERAKEIEVPFRFYDVHGEINKIEVIFQAGRLAGKDSTIPENPGLVFETIIYQYQPLSPDPETPPSDEKARFIRINLTDEDRRKLGGANHFRIIVTAALDTGETITGRLILATPVVKGAGFRPVIVKNNEIVPSADTNAPFTDNVIVMEAPDTSTPRLADKYGGEVNRLHPDGKSNRILEAAWAGLESNTGAGADQRINAAPLGNYRVVSFFVRRPKASNGGGQLDNGYFRFLLGNGPRSYNNSGEKILEAVFPLAAFDSAGIAEGEWAKVEIRYQGSSRGIYIDGANVLNLPDASLSYRPDLFAENTSLWLAFLVTPGSQSSLPDGGMALDELVLEEAVALYRFNAGGNFNWNLPGSVIAIGDVPILSDLAFSAAAESGAGGNPFEDETTNSLGMNGRTKAEFSLLGIKMIGNYSYSLLSRSYDETMNYNWRAGHSVSRAWGGFSIAESFDLAPADSALQHKVSAALNAPVRFSLLGDLALRDGRYEKKWQSLIGGNIASLPLDMALGVNAGWTTRTANPGSINNYAAAWAESFAPLLPDPGASALKREAAANFTVDLGTAPLGFRLIAEGTSLFSDLEKTTVSNTRARIEFPWNLIIDSKPYLFLFREERAYRRNLMYDGADFNDDLGRFGEALGDSVPLMFGIPFYSFFDPNAQTTLLDANTGIFDGSFLNSGRFTEVFEFSLSTPENYTVSALFIPSRISLRIDRVMDQKLDILQDTLNYGGTLDFSAVNLFGALGANPVFTFYAADQFNHSLDASITMPRNGTTGFRVQSGQELLFHGFSGAELSLTHLLTFGSSGFANNETRWTDTVSAAWLCPVEKSLLGTIYAAIIGALGTQSSWLPLAELGKEEYELLRRESLNFVYEYTPGTVSAASRFELELMHESLVRILGKLNLSFYAKLNIREDFNKKEFEAIAGAGVTLKITF